MIRNIHHFISLTLVEPSSLKTIKITIVYKIFNKKLRASEICALRCSHEERVEEISGLIKLERGDCSLGFKEVFCKLSRNYIHKQTNSAELKKTVARLRGAL